jgi:hypothetical protein
MAYIDGSKDKFANLHYFERITPYLSPGCLVVFDDIHWSSEMWEAWRTLRQWIGLTHAINAGRFGVCVWNGGAVRPRTYDLYKVASVDMFAVKQRLESMKLRGPFS